MSSSASTDNLFSWNDPNVMGPVMSVQDIDRYLLSGIKTDSRPQNTQDSFGRHKAENLDASAAGRNPVLSNIKSMGVGRWEDPPSALQELREAKTKTYAQQRVQVDLGVTEADIDAVLSSVRSSLPRPPVNSQVFPTSFNHDTELPDIAGREFSVNTQSQNVHSQFVHEAKYGAFNANESLFQPGKPFADSRMSRAAIWMGVLFAFVFVAAYSLSENIHQGGASLPPQATAQQLMSEHTMRMKGKILFNSHKSAGLYKAAVHLQARRAAAGDSHAAAHVAASASGNPALHPILHPAHKASSARQSNDSGDSTKSAIVKAEEKRMAKQIEESNDRFVDAMIKSGS